MLQDTRSPYQEGEVPQYMIIESEQIVNYYSKYYENLWANAAKIDISTLNQFYSLYKSSYDDDTKKRIENKINTIISRRGIKHDI